MRLMGPMRLMRLIGPIRPMRPMRPMRLMGLMGLIGLMGCSGDDGASQVPEPEPVPVPVERPIAFSPNLPDEQPVTRSSVPLNETGVTSFMVWGYKNMSLDAGNYGGLQEVFTLGTTDDEDSGFEVRWQAGSAATTTTNSVGWEYILADKPSQTIKYWDWSAKAYRFFAVTGWDGSAPQDIDRYGASNTYTSENTSLAYTISMRADASSKDAMDASPYFSRLWFSDGTATYPDKQFGQPVTLEFVKPYARVRFMFKYVFPRVAYNMTERSFKPSADGVKIVRKGEVRVIYPKSGTQTQERYGLVPNANSETNKALVAFTEDYDPENESKVYTDSDNGWYTVLPNTSQGNYKLTAKINGSDRVVEVPAQYMQWKPGYQYTYVFKITEEGGVEIGWVEYAMVPWREMEADWKVYNW